MCCLLGCCSADPTHHDIILNKGRRSCTDCFFLLILFLFCCGLGTTSWYALSHGDPYRILYGSDSFGNTCGRTNDIIVVRTDGGGADDERREFELSGQDMTQRRYMFPLNVTRPLDSVWTCVRECPVHNLFTAEDIREQAAAFNNSLCVSKDASLNMPKDGSVFGVCPKLPVMKSLSIMNRCIPEDILTFGQELVNKVIELDFVRSYLSDIVSAAPLILRMCAVAFVISLVTVYVLRFFAGVVIYFVYILIVLVVAGIAAALWYSVYLVYTNTEAMNGTALVQGGGILRTTASPQVQVAEFFNVGESSFQSWFEFKNTSQLTVLGLAIGATVITIFVTVVVWCLFPRGKKMVDLFQKASKALAAMPFLLFQPIFSSLAVVLIAMYSISAGLVLYTAGEPVTRLISDGGNGTITIIETNMTETTRIMMLYQLVGFVWLCEFVMACQRLFVAGAISMWYFNTRRGEPGQSRSAVCSSMYNVVRYHLGSAALGSFIITLVRFPRYILMWIYAKMKAVENPLARKLLMCFICVLGCIESCLSYINNNAYTVISYSGASFCPAAKVAVNILLDNAVDVATVNTVGDAVLFLAKCIVATITAAIAMFNKDLNELAHPWLPVLVIFVCAYLISNCFLSVYEMAIDTLFLCCAEDVELSRENPDNEFTNKEFKEMIVLSSSSDSRSNFSRRNRQELDPLYS